MTPQRIAIAEACGYKLVPVPSSSLGGGEPSMPQHLEFWLEDGWEEPIGLPDYLNDLNAMHGAWQVGIRDSGEDEAFCRQLRLIACPQKCNCSECSYTINATAAQRAEAFLRCLSLWTDDPPAAEVEGKR